MASWVDAGAGMQQSNWNVLLAAYDAAALYRTRATVCATFFQPVSLRYERQGAVFGASDGLLVMPRIAAFVCPSFRFSNQQRH